MTQPTIPHQLLQNAREGLRKGTTDLAHLAGLIDEELEATYGVGLEAMRAGLDARARDIFGALVVLRPGAARYHRALGLATQRTGHPGVAYLCYGVALRLEPTDLIAKALRAECALVVEGKRKAVPALREVADTPSPTVQQAPYVQRARDLLNLLSQSGAQHDQN